MDDFYSHHNANVAPRPCTCWPGGDRAVRGCARQGRGVHRRAAPGRGRLHQELLRGAQPRRQRARPGPTSRAGCGPATKWSSPRWSTTPTSCRGSWSPSAPARPCAGSASTMTAGSTSTSIDEHHHRAHQGRVARTRVRMPRHAQPGRGRSPLARTRSARWSSSTPRSRCRRCRSTCPARRGLRRVHRPQDVRTDRHRRAVGPIRPAREAPAVPRWRRDDRDGRRWPAPPTPPPPHRFEAGTPPIAQAVGLGAAVDYLSAIGMDKVAAHEHAITGYALDRLTRGRRACASSARRPPTHRGGAISLVVDGVHPHDVSQVLDARRCRRTRRPPLRPSGVPALRRGSDDPGVVLPLHDTAGGRRA